MMAREMREDVRFTGRLMAGVAGATLAGCSGSSSTTGAEAPTAVPDAGNTLDGSYAFPVRYSVVDTQLAHDQCGYQTVLSGGAYAAFALWLSDVDVFDDAGGMFAVTPSPSHILSIQVAGPSYVGSNTPPSGTDPKPIRPGVFPIGFEDADDDELCSLPSGGAATLDRYDFAGDAGEYTQATAVSGSVTLTQAGQGHVVGRFDVQIAPIVYGDVFIDTQHAVAFSGTFDATGM
jgi:hypothetical protein